MDVIQTRVSTRGKRKVFQLLARFWFRSLETGTDPASMISDCIRLPLPVTKEAAGIWTATATKNAMAVTAIAGFGPLESRETSPLPETGTEPEEVRSVCSDPALVNGSWIGTEMASGMAATLINASRRSVNQAIYP